MAPPLTPASEEVPEWLDRAAYPFALRWFDQPTGRMHYVDEGKGDVLLFVHGNPSWSFEYRRLINHFSTNYRCIAVDHIGFGLSDHPADASYLPQEHATNLARLVRALDLRNITLVVQDWGGPIALGAMLDMPDRVRAVIASNSWFFDVRENKVLKWFSLLVGGPVGRFLCARINFFPRVLMKASFGDPARLDPSTHRQYLAPFQTVASRKGTWVFPRAITGESEWLASLWARRQSFGTKPALLIWGMKDDAFAPLLPQWEGAFADHETVLLADVGHNVGEEAGELLIAPIAKFLAGNGR